MTAEVKKIELFHPRGVLPETGDWVAADVTNYVSRVVNVEGEGRSQKFWLSEGGYLVPTHFRNGLTDDRGFMRVLRKDFMQQLRTTLSGDSDWQSLAVQYKQELEKVEGELKALLDVNESLTKKVHDWQTVAKLTELQLEEANKAKLAIAIEGNLNIPEVVQLALDAVQGPRNQSYGAASRNFSDIAGLLAASGFIRRNGEFITPAQVALIQLCVKLSRLMHTPDHKDSVVDIIGYMLCYWQCVEAQKDAQKEG